MDLMLIFVMIALNVLLTMNWKIKENKSYTIYQDMQLVICCLKYIFIMIIIIIDDYFDSLFISISFKYHI